MQYLVIARDGTDKDALDRRMAARPAHMVGAKALKQAGNILIGGAILDDDDRMVGSAVIVEFATEAELDHWLATDPYVTEGVWEEIEVRPFRVAPL